MDGVARTLLFTHGKTFAAEDGTPPSAAHPVGCCVFRQFFESILFP